MPWYNQQMQPQQPPQQDSTGTNANASAANASAPPTLDDEHSGFEAVALGQYDAKVRVRG